MVDSKNILWSHPFNLSHDLIAGVDEVGRGALFGPVVAAAVILAEDSVAQLTAAGVRDSKQLNSAQRLTLAQKIRQVALEVQIGTASAWEIDQLNILQASLLAMQRAVLKLKLQPQLCLIDGNRPIPCLSLPQRTLVKGDEKVLAIAAASIVAKVWRDRRVIRLSLRYPEYDLAANKGYGSVKHRLALQQLGPSPLHRLSFSPCQVKPQLKN